MNTRQKVWNNDLKQNVLANGTYFCAIAESGLIDISDDIVEVIKSAIDHDGFKHDFNRDENGRMWLYRSKIHVGNNPFSFESGNSSIYSWYSMEEDDEKAKNAIYMSLINRRYLHYKYDIWIEERTYSNGVLTHIDGSPISA